MFLMNIVKRKERKKHTKTLIPANTSCKQTGQLTVISKRPTSWVYICHLLAGLKPVNGYRTVQITNGYRTVQITNGYRTVQIHNFSSMRLSNL